MLPGFKVQTSPFLHNVNIKAPLSFCTSRLTSPSSNTPPSISYWNAAHHRDPHRSAHSPWSQIIYLTPVRLTPYCSPHNILHLFALLISRSFPSVIHHLMLTEPPGPIICISYILRL
ncbi:hypothetical protein ILYODFUR_036577 [Ilyodon furcidens]|uniref:Uncharacterized protein n=1 Tax=Ilyodon furcidens TaxID=33524 RepID=A0ABV0TRL2_9TELE